MDQLKIAFGFRMGTGKGTSAQILKDLFGGTVLSFATPIYEIMEFAQDKCNRSHEKDRLFLQIVGTEWGRTVDEDIWTNILLDKAANLGSNVFVDDLRFPNEMSALQRAGWKCVLVQRHHTTERVGNGSSEHRSESALSDSDNWDYVIDNTRSIEDLRLELIQMVTFFHLKTATQ